MAARAQPVGLGSGPAVHHIVEVAVVVALEFDKLFTARAGSGDAQRMHVGFPPSVAKTHLVHPGHARETLGQLDFDRGGRGEEHTVLDRLGYPAVDLRVGMAQNDRPKPQPIVEVAVAVDIPDGGTRPAFQDGGLLSPVAEVGVDTVRNKLLGLLKKVAGFVQVMDHRLARFGKVVGRLSAVAPDGCYRAGGSGG